MKAPYYNWPEHIEYNSLEGWEYEKQRAKEVAKLQLKFAKLNIMISKTTDMRNSAHSVGDNRLLLKYAAIESRLLESQCRIAEKLLFDYRVTLDF